MITKEQVNEAFRNVTLEENYNFLEDDLVKLAEAFINAAKPAIIAMTIIPYAFYFGCHLSLFRLGTGGIRGGQARVAAA